MVTPRYYPIFRPNEIPDDIIEAIRTGANLMARLTLNPEIGEVIVNCKTVLHFAATCGNEKAVQQLLDLGCDVNSLNSNHETALMIAVRRKNYGHVRVLLEANADINIVNNFRTSALQLAFSRKHFCFLVARLFYNKLKSECNNNIYQVAYILLRANCNVSHAAYLRDIDLIKCMLDQGSPVDAKTYVNRTALQTAAEYNELQIAKLLLDYGADVNILDDDNETALLNAIWCGNKDMIKLLLDRGANVYPERTFENVPTFMALFFSSEDITQDKYIDCAELLFEYNVYPDMMMHTRTHLINKARLRGLRNLLYFCIDRLAMLHMLEGNVNSQPCSAYPHYQRYYEQCKRFLDTTIFGDVKILDLLICSDNQLIAYVRNRQYFATLERLWLRNKPKELYAYYYRILTKRVIRATSRVNLENSLLKRITELFNQSYNQYYIAAKEIASYLPKEELEKLCQL